MTAIGPLGLYFNHLETALADATATLRDSQEALANLVNHTTSWKEMNNNQTLLTDDQITEQVGLYRNVHKIREAALDALSLIEEAFRICDIPPSKLKIFKKKFGEDTVEHEKTQLDERVEKTFKGTYKQLFAVDLAITSQFSEAKKPLNALICRARTQGDGYIKSAFDWIRDRDFVREEIAKLREDEATPQYA